MRKDLKIDEKQCGIPSLERLAFNIATKLPPAHLRHGLFACPSNETGKKVLFNLFEPVLAARELLPLVILRDLYNVKISAAAHPELILVRGEITDCAGRIFYSISAWEYALWSCDRFLWQILLRHIPEDQMPQALEQLKNLRHGNGVEYTILDEKTHALIKKRESYFDTSPLVNALNNPIRDGRIDNRDEWIKQTGHAQKFLPFHVFYELCRTFSADEYSKFNEKNPPLNSSVTYHCYNTYISDDWWKIYPKLGKEFVIIRNGYVNAMAFTALRLSSSMSLYSTKVDVKMILRLFSVRKKELQKLEENLTAQVIESENQRQFREQLAANARDGLCLIM